MPSRSSTDTYIDLAISVLRAHRWPLTAHQILAYAREHSMIPPHLHGATPHKTLNARISEHIRASSAAKRPPLIYRVAPATYYLTELQDNPDTPHRFRKAYHGLLRYKQVRPEQVLVCSVQKLSELGLLGFVPFSEGLFSKTLTEHLRFLNRKSAKGRSDVKQFISYTIILKSQQVLCYTRGNFTTVSEALKGSRSIGFGGHINETDFDLFSTPDDCVVNSAARELCEELGIDDIHPARLEGISKNFGVLGILNIDDTDDAKAHLAVVSAYHPKYDATLEKQELSINNIAWLDIFSDYNIEEFEPWSQVLLHLIRAGLLRIDELFKGLNW